MAGLTFRHIHGEQDADAVCAIHMGRKERDQIDPLSTVESLPSRDQVLATLSPVVKENHQDRTLLAEVNERGIDVIRLHTVAEFRTRARELYGSPGFRVLKEFPRYRKPFALDNGEKMA
jgi:hypothetical protein